MLKRIRKEDSKMKNITKIIIIAMILLGYNVFADRVETEVVQFQNGFKTGSDTNIYTSLTSVSNTPYIVQYALSNDISFANGNLQYYAPTNTTTIYLPEATTNEAYRLTLIVNPNTNSFSISSVNMTTNGAGSYTSVTITNSGSTTLEFWKEYFNPNWKVYGL